MGTVHLESGVTASFRPFDTDTDEILVNAVNFGSPGVSGGAPLSMVGLSRGLLDPSNANIPGITVDPEGGTYDHTLAVHIRALPAPNNPNGNTGILFSINREPPTILPSKHTHIIHLMEDTALTVWAVQGTNSSAQVTTNYTIRDPAGPRRDSDGDGLPDAWEIANGFDPLVSDLNRDGDGDGWSDFEELVRNCPAATCDSPLDSDGDGWSDFDENLRNTNPNDPPELTEPNNPERFYPSRPVANRLREVEYVLGGRIWSDADETVPMLKLRELSVYDLYWRPAFRQSHLPSEAALNANPNLPSLTELDLPYGLRASVVATYLDAGMLPPVRLRASNSQIVRARLPGSKWVVKAWIDATPDLHPRATTAYLNSLGTPWTTPTEWQAGYVKYLSENLVQTLHIALSPRSGLALALFEGAVAWHSNINPNTLLLAGNSTSPKPVDAITAVEASMAFDADPGASQLRARSLDALHADLATLVIPGGLLDRFVNKALGYYADPNKFTFLDPKGMRDVTTTAAVAELVQGDPADNDTDAHYLARLFVGTPTANLDALAPTERAALIDPDGDVDGDLLPNAIELSRPIATASNPQAIDSDGDGYLDGTDPCPADFANSCYKLAELNADSDGDGFVDAIDNCMNIGNPDQMDSSGATGLPDGIGDACVRPANIRTPVANVRVHAGTSVLLTSLRTELSAPEPYTLAWKFSGGAPDIEVENPGFVRFNVPGTYMVTFTVTDGAGIMHPPDMRTVVVE